MFNFKDFPGPTITWEKIMSYFKQKFPLFRCHSKALQLRGLCLLPSSLHFPHSKVNTVLKINDRAPKTVVLHTDLIFPDSTKLKKNLISKTPVSLAELLSLIIIPVSLKTLAFLFVFTFYFLKEMIISLKHCLLCLGKKTSIMTKGQHLFHLPRGGPCVMSMSMPSGMRFHLSSRD